ncbi:MAG: hypothetical protein ABR950_06760 [Candidatus Dormibacteria bacterium]
MSVCLWQLLGTFTPTPVAFLFYAVLTGMGVSAVVAALRRPGAARASVRRPGPEAPRPWMP